MTGQGLGGESEANGAGNPVLCDVGYPSGLQIVEAYLPFNWLKPNLLVDSGSFRIDNCYHNQRFNPQVLKCIARGLINKTTANASSPKVRMGSHIHESPYPPLYGYA